MNHFITVLLFALFMGFPVHSSGTESVIPESDTSIDVYSNIVPALKKELTDRSLQLGDPIYIRIFKNSSELELWMRKGKRFILFRTYRICDYSGYLGPKLREGDKQSPEGFYSVGIDQLNPWSNFHLSFNLGFPNEYDRAHSRTGSALMIHGRCSSAGCGWDNYKYVID